MVGVDRHQQQAGHLFQHQLHIGKRRHHPMLPSKSVEGELGADFPQGALPYPLIWMTLNLVVRPRRSSSPSEIITGGYV